LQKDRFDEAPNRHARRVRYPANLRCPGNGNAAPVSGNYQPASKNKNKSEKSIERCRPFFVFLPAEA
jgi:hypothetical protein